MDLVALSGSDPITDGQGTWSVSDGIVTSQWFILRFDSATGTTSTVSIEETGEVDVRGNYSGSLSATVAGEGGTATTVSGSSTGQRLSG